jgi:hypothetical protein
LYFVLAPLTQGRDDAREMATARIKGEPNGAGCYHVMSRTVNDESGGIMFFGAREKNVFARQLRKHAEFAGIEVMTWCMMDNHFHLLIRVPNKVELLDGLMANGRKEFWKRLRVIYSGERVKALKDEVETAESRAGTADQQRATDILARYTRRMGDLSLFVRELKYAFSVWFNRRNGRKGTLWMNRFKSVLLEGEPWVLKKVAAYIDLNPVRAGLVKDPGRYRWSGYGEALGGNAPARRGLSGAHGYCRLEWRRIAASYRALLFQEGVEVHDSAGKVVRVGVDDEAYFRESASGGRQGATRRLANRVRYFADGAAIGSREFLDEVFERNRSLFGPRRKTGPRKFRGQDWKGAEWFSLRDLGGHQ